MRPSPARLARPIPVRLALSAAVGLLAGPRPATALDPDKAVTQYIYDRWSTDQGLPQNSVGSIVQTRDGYLWLGTPSGLVRFDGARFTLFDRGTTPALKSNTVQALLEAQDGALWISTGGGGLARFQAGRLTGYSVADGLSSNQPGPLLEEPDGTLWIGTADGGLLRRREGRFTRYSTAQGLANTNVNALARDRDGGLWIGTDGGLNRLTTAGMAVWTTRQGLPSDTVYALQADRDGSMWVGTNRGLARIQKDVVSTFGKREGFEGGRVECFLQDRDGNLWVGTYGSGLYRYRDGHFSQLSTREGLADDIVWALYEDAEGSLWIGTRGGGLGRLKDGPFRTYGVAEGLPNGLVWAVREDKAGAIWVATDGGLSRLEHGHFTTLTTRDGLSSDMVRALLEDRQGRLWIGTWGGGLDRLQDGRVSVWTTRQGLAHDVVRALLEDRSGDLWIGTYGGGLDRLHEGRLTHFGRSEGLNNDHIYALHEARDGALWIATRGGGLNRMAGGALTALTWRDGLPDDVVLALHEDAQGALWIGTRSGLARWKGGRVAPLAGKAGLFDHEVYQILEDDQGDLWMSSEHGIVRVRKSDLDAQADGAGGAVSFVVYGKGDGLRRMECTGGVQPAGIRARDGRLWFPTIAGLAVVDPKRLQPNRRSPPVRVEEVLADGRSLSPGEPVAAGARELQFHYAGLSLRAPERVRFRYRLEGFDRDWVDAGPRRVAYYTNLPPGNYGFRVIACNDDGLWNEVGDSRSVYVGPRWHETIWIRILAGALLVLLGLGTYRLRVEALKARERRLIQLVAERTRELQAANQSLRETVRLKEELVSMVSHDFRSPLAVLQGYAELLEQRVTDPVSLDMLGLITDQTHQLESLANDTLTLSRIESGGLPVERQTLVLDDVVRGVVSAQDPAVSIQFEAAGEPVVVEGDRQRLVQLVQNLVGNAVKYSPPGAPVRVAVQRNGAEARLTVADEGIGMRPEDLPRLFQKFSRLENARRSGAPGTGLGLYICRSIVEAHGGRIWAESEPQKGSTFFVTLPLPAGQATSPA